MHRTVKVAAAAAAGVLVAGSFSVAASATGTRSAPQALPTNWYAAAPYLMPADNNPPDPGAIMDATGQKAFQLAFILSDGGCTPAWDGKTSLNDATSIQQAIDTIRGKGGDVSVSVGGYGGTKLGQVCSDAASTAAAYQQVIDKYGLHAIDFDLEEPEYENSAAIAKELGAAKILQNDNDGLYISVTTAGTPAGTGWFGTQLLDQAKSIGFTPSNFSIMPFDNGFGGGGDSQVAALEAFHGLLESHMGWDSEFAYQHEGVSGMNGRTDAAEYFRQDDFQTVLDYALDHHLGRYTFWSANRDRECDPPENSKLSGECSSVAQKPWEFTTYTTAFAKGTTVVDPPTTPPGGGGDDGTCPAAAWDADTVYTGGDQVSYDGHAFTAKWWTKGQAPDSSNQWGPWKDDGPCTASGSAAAVASASGTVSTTAVSYQQPGAAHPRTVAACPAAWDADTVYTGGDTVSYDGHAWTAKWWTKGQAPDASQQWGPWTDNGPCGSGPEKPGAPSDLTVTGHTASSVSLAWTAPSGTVTKYHVYQGDSEVVSTTDTNVTVSGLQADTKYSFSVSAENAAGEGARSAEVSATTDAGTPPSEPPAAPTGLSKTGVSATSVSLSWTAPGGQVDTYTVYQDGKKVDTTTGTTDTIGGLQPKTEYSFTVSATNAAGESDQSAALSVTTGDNDQGGDHSGYIDGNGDGKTKLIYFDQWSIYQNAYYLKDLDAKADDLDYIIYDFENIHPTNLTCFETTKATTPDPGGESDPNAGDGAGDAFADYQKSFSAATSVDGQADTYDEPIVGNFNQLKKLKARHPNLKVLLSIGGWTYSKYFSDAAATDASRKKFVSSCIDMFLDGNIPEAGGYGGDGTAAGIFDGFDIDWEYPASDTGHVGNHYSPDDTQNYTKLLAEFRTELDAYGKAHGGKHYGLAAALPGGQDKVSKIETDKIGNYLDFGNAMTYDLHGAWDAQGPTNLQDPLFPSPDDPSNRIGDGGQQYDSDTILKAYTVGDPAYGIPGGFPAEKLTLGIPMYYRGWTGVDAGDNHGLYSAATGPSAPHALSGNVPGIALQKELDSLGFFNGGKEFYDSQRMAGWYYDGTTFYAGSTPQSIVDHVAYAKCNGLAGVMIFSAYDETATSQPLLDKIISEDAKPKPSDCSKYATDTWGVFGPPDAANADTAQAGPADGGNNVVAAPPAPAVLPEQRRKH